MVASLLRSTALAVALAVGLAGCASTSYRTDLDRVRELAHAPIPLRVADRAVEAEAAAEVRAALRAPLTADVAVRVALANNRHLRGAMRDLGVARGWMVQAGTLPNPVIEFDLRHQADRTQSLQGDFAVEYDLTRALLTPQREGVARAELDAARLRAAGEVVALGYRVRTAFQGAQAADERLTLARRSLDAFAASRDAARALFDAGNVPSLDVASQEAAYERARVTVADLELEALVRREALNRLLGLYGDHTAWTLAAPLPPVPSALPEAEPTESRAIVASLELAMLRSRLDAMARRAGLSRAEGWLPDVSVDVHAEQDGNSIEVGGGLRMSLPLFDQRRGATGAYEAGFDALMERYHGAAADLRSALREARFRWRSGHARARHFEATIVPARRRVFDETLRQYNAMQVGVFQLLQARRELLDAELAQTEARRRYWTAAAALDALMAGRRVDGPTTDGTTTDDFGAEGASTGEH